MSKELLSCPISLPLPLSPVWLEDMSWVYFCMCECSSVFTAVEAMKRTMHFSQRRKGTRKVHFNLWEYKQIEILKKRCRTWKITEHGAMSERGSSSRLQRKPTKYLRLPHMCWCCGGLCAICARMCMRTLWQWPSCMAWGKEGLKCT